jgi:hypothetical protein
MRKRIEIELQLPFEENIKRARALPPSPDGHTDEELASALGRLFELAHGRSVRTTLGPVAIAPAVAPFLARSRFSFSTRCQLLAALRHQMPTPPKL